MLSQNGKNTPTRKRSSLSIYNNIYASSPKKKINDKLFLDLFCRLYICFISVNKLHKSCQFICRHVVNGEILGVSLLLEDVLQNGLPDDILGVPDDGSSVTSTCSILKAKDRRQTSRAGVGKLKALFF